MTGGNIQKKDGTQEFYNKVLYMNTDLLGENYKPIGYINEDNNLYMIESDRVVQNQRLLSETMQFGSIYDTDKEDMGMKLSYGLVQDEASNTTGIYYPIYRYNGHDLVSTITAKYKIENDVLYLENINDNNEGTGVYEKIDDSASVRKR